MISKTTQKALQKGEKKRKLLLLQQEYLVKSLSKIEEMIAMSLQLEILEDPDMIKSYIDAISKLDLEVENDYRVASEIEELVK